MIFDNLVNSNATPRGALLLLTYTRANGDGETHHGSRERCGNTQRVAKDTTQQRKGRAMNESDKQVLLAIFKTGCRLGDTLTELSELTGYSRQRLASVAKKYDGRRFKGGYIGYIGSQTGSMRKDSPGIKNPNTGICASIPASIYVVRSKKG